MWSILLLTDGLLDVKRPPFKAVLELLELEGLSRRRIASFKAFSATLETLKPKSLAFLNTPSSIRILVTIFFPNAVTLINNCITNKYLNVPPQTKLLCMSHVFIMAIDVGTSMGSAVGYSFDVCRKLVKINPEPAMIDRTIMVDTNYLILVNQKDIACMFFDPNYEDSASSPKKQMARLFRDARNRKLDLCFSNLIMREFIGRAPKRKEMLEIYKKYISVITPVDNLESHFLDLAAAINSCIIESGQEGDIKDTYSYILATLAEVRYFVTEDKDVDRVYVYLSRVREKDLKAIAREIRKIKGVFKLLCEVPESAFPIDDVLGFLFLHSSPLPVPVSILKLKDRLPDVLDRTETILWMFRSLQEIAELRRYVTETPEGWNKRIIEKAKSRIGDVAQSIGLQTLGSIDGRSFNIKLVEEGTNWREESTDQKLATDLSDQLNLLWNIVHGEEEVEYMTRDDQFDAEEPTKEFTVKCDTCGKQLEVEAHYQGVVDAYEREMGKELCYQWLTELSCPSCGETLRIIYELWEYPEWWFNYEGTECCGCELVGEKTTEPPTTTLADFFSENPNARAPEKLKET